MVGEGPIPRSRRLQTPADTPVGDDRLELSLLAARRGWLRRRGERAGVVKELQPIRISWGESMVGEGPIARSHTRQIAEGRPVGAYGLGLSLLAAGREPLVVERAIQVVP